MRIEDKQAMAKAFKGYGTYLGALAPIVSLIPGGQVAAPLLALSSSLYQASANSIEKRLPKIVSASPGLKVNYSYGGSVDPQVVLQNLIRASYVLPPSKGKLTLKGKNAAYVGGNTKMTDSEKFFVPYA